MSDCDVIAESVVLEKTVGTGDFIASRYMPSGTVVDGVPDLERLTAEAMRESAPLLKRLKGCEPHSVTAWPRTPHRRMPESRANAR
jgi:hypothetical protein